MRILPQIHAESEDAPSSPPKVLDAPAPGRGDLSRGLSDLVEVTETGGGERTAGTEPGADCEKHGDALDV